MKSFLCIVTALALCASQVQAVNWAVIAAGSNGFYNYRHQADVCHSYQMLRKNGFQDENIIVFMYDDIANSPQNPKKGQVFNYHDLQQEVYAGVPKDYIGKDTTATNFLKVLRGDDMTGIGSGKSLKSTKDDKVFVFFSDHGATGLVAFPNDLLYANDLVNTLHKMSDENRFKELVIYVEACESGSMFNGLLSKDKRIFATTASTPFESSYACDYSSDINAYLSDCYSYNFINDTESFDVGKATLAEQFDRIRAETTMSRVCEYGDLDISKETLGEFMAANKKLRTQASGASPNKIEFPSFINQRQAFENQLLHQMKEADESQAALLKDQLASHRQYIHELEIRFSTFKAAFGLNIKAASDSDQCFGQKINAECLKANVENYQYHCGKVDEHTLEYVKYLSAACNDGVSTDEVARFFQKKCATETITM